MSSPPPSPPSTPPRGTDASARLQGKGVVRKPKPKSSRPALTRGVGSRDVLSFGLEADKAGGRRRRRRKSKRKSHKKSHKKKRRTKRRRKSRKKKSKRRRRR